MNFAMRSSRFHSTICPIWRAHFTFQAKSKKYDANKETACEKHFYESIHFEMLNYLRQLEKAKCVLIAE